MLMLLGMLIVFQLNVDMFLVLPIRPLMYKTLQYDLK